MSIYLRCTKSMFNANIAVGLSSEQLRIAYLKFYSCYRKWQRVRLAQTVDFRKAWHTAYVTYRLNPISGYLCTLCSWKIINCDMLMKQKEITSERVPINQQRPGHKSTVSFRRALLLPLWFNKNKPILLYSIAELTFNAALTNTINPVPVQLCTVWGTAGRRRRRWTAPIPCGLRSSQPAGFIGAFLTWTAKVISQ